MVVEPLDTINHSPLSENFFCLLGGAIGQKYFHRMQVFSNFLKTWIGSWEFQVRKSVFGKMCKDPYRCFWG